MSKKIIYVIGGGTVSYIRNHLALAAPAYGSTAINLAKIISNQLNLKNIDDKYEVKLVLTKMADRNSKLETNEDVNNFVTEILKDENTKAIIFNPALVDYTGTVGDVESGKYATRLQTREGETCATLVPAEKVVATMRKDRKDVFVVAFKTTTGATSLEQYVRGLDLLKSNSINLVLANDTVTRNNMIIAPEETKYCETTNREDVLEFLGKMVVSRMQNKFTRSTLVEGDAVPWNSEQVPASLREVVNYCITRGAYKPFKGKTAGHFAIKLSDNEILTSIRKSNFNELAQNGLVHVTSNGVDEVIARGHKPSVGGQSQRIIFKEHPDLDCIVHFHCPIADDSDLYSEIPVKAQWPNECGSHECGQNTSNGLRKFDLGDGDSLHAVFLDDHGPNIVFNQKTDPHKVISFIERNFLLDSKTGGLFQ